MMNNPKWHSLAKAAELMGIDQEALIALIVADEIKAGVIARAWWGFWVLPEWFDKELTFGTTFGPVDVRYEGDRAIRTYFWERPDKGDLMLEEFFACQYWHMQHWELYELLVVSPSGEIEITQLVPLESDHKQLLKQEPAIVAEEGFFGIHSKEPNRRIIIDDLVIHDSEIRRELRNDMESRIFCIKKVAADLGIEIKRYGDRASIQNECLRRYSGAPVRMTESTFGKAWTETLKRQS